MDNINQLITKLSFINIGEIPNDLSLVDQLKNDQDVFEIINKLDRYIAMHERRINEINLVKAARIKKMEELATIDKKFGPNKIASIVSDFKNIWEKLDMDSHLELKNIDSHIVDKQIMYNDQEILLQIMLTRGVYTCCGTRIIQLLNFSIDDNDYKFDTAFTHQILVHDKIEPKYNDIVKLDNFIATLKSFSTN